MKDPKDMTEEELEKAVHRYALRCEAAIDAENNALREYREAQAAMQEAETELLSRRRSTPPGGAK